MLVGSNENKLDRVWHSLPLDEVWRILESSVNGLESAQVKERLMRLGSNSLPKPQPTSATKIFFRQFASALIVVLLVAAVITLSIGEFLDSLVILMAVTANVIVGFLHERKAEKALAELRKFVKYEAKVIRHGLETKVAMEEIVPGDVIHIAAGDRIPADARIVRSYNLETNEAPLTGESQTVGKSTLELAPGTVLAERVNMVYMGTTVTAGDGLAVVAATGKNTEFGSIAQMLSTIIDEKTPLQQKLAKFGQGVGMVVVLICSLLLVVGLAVGYPFRQMFTMAVAIAVSAVPEGLVVVVTAILALGMQRILKRQVLVRKLVAAETLGSTTVICADKTGTLTTGEMRVARIITPDDELVPEEIKLEDGSSVMSLLKVSTLSSDAYVENPEDELKDWVVVGSPTERALVWAGQQAGIEVTKLKGEYQRIDVVPFSSEKKYMLTMHQLPRDGRMIYLKGAPEKVLAACTQMHVKGKNHKFEETDKKRILLEVEKLSGQGLRLLAFASREAHDKEVDLATATKQGLNNFVLLGLVGIKDPLREEVRETVQAAWRAGIKVVMITGDHHLTAQTIAGEVGLPAAPENILEGEELQTIDDATLKERVANISVFARTAPHDKLRIVNAWQARGDVVAMTGDGVNDAPALKAADIGVALGSGSDVAKEAADMVLLNNNLSSIVAAVEEGRTIYHNIRRVVLYLMSDSFAEMFLIFGAFLWRIELPILATQVLWVNLVCDSFPAIALTAEPPSPDVMEQAPIKRREAILDRQRKFVIIIFSLLKGVGALLIFNFLTSIGLTLADNRTVVFTAMSVSSLAFIFSCKHLNKSLFDPHTWKNKKLIFAVAVSFCLQIAAIYVPFLQEVFHTVPLHFSDWLFILSFCALLIFIFEMIKALMLSRRVRLVAKFN